MYFIFPLPSKLKSVPKSSRFCLDFLSFSCSFHRVIVQILLHNFVLNVPRLDLMMWLCGLAALVWNFGSVVVFVVFDKMQKKKGCRRKKKKKDYVGFHGNFLKFTFWPLNFCLISLWPKSGKFQSILPLLNFNLLLHVLCDFLGRLILGFNT